MQKFSWKEFVSSVAVFTIVSVAIGIWWQTDSKDGFLPLFIRAFVVGTICIVFIYQLKRILKFSK